MISGGNATIFVSNMDASIGFYAEVLGMKLTNRFGDSWATLDAGKGLVIGLHPASQRYPAPGTRGATMLGLETTEPIDRVLAKLAERGVRPLKEVERSEAGAFAHLEDPDGNELYLWEVNPVMVPAGALETADATR